jgi:hypothetical protein
MDPHTTPTPTSSHADEDVIAAILSIIPGLGHLYKGWIHEGLGCLLVGFPIFFFIGGILGLATLGLGLLLPLFYIAGVAWHAYSIDRRHHHLPSFLHHRPH